MSRTLTPEEAGEAASRVRELSEYFKQFFPELHQVRVAVIGGPYDQEHEEINYWIGARDDFMTVSSSGYTSGGYNG